MKRICMIFGMVFTITAMFNASAGQEATQRKKPDIVVALCDDMCYSDPGCFGGEIETPNLDELASAGMRFSQFYNCDKCVSTRISLMSGQYEGRAGGRPLKTSVSMGEALRPLGYRTIAVGKWHLDEKKDPTQYGFDRHFGHLNGLCNYFTGNDHYWKNGKPYKDFPTDFYATDAFTDFSIECIKESIAEDPERVEAMKVRWHEMAQTETKVSGKYLKPLAEQSDPWAENPRRERIPGDIYKMRLK